jgi:hypothetical protein
MYRKIMGASISGTEKKRGRGRPRLNPKSIHLTLVPDQLAGVDKWASGQSDKPSRPEAIRRIIELGLTVPANKISVIIAAGDANLASQAAIAPRAAGAGAAKLATGAKTASRGKTRQKRS